MDVSYFWLFLKEVFKAEIIIYKYFSNVELLFWKWDKIAQAFYRQIS